MCIINSPGEILGASDLDCRSSARPCVAKHSSPDAPGATRRAGGPAGHGRRVHNFGAGFSVARSQCRGALASGEMFLSP